MHGAEERGARTKLGPPWACERTLRDTSPADRPRLSGNSWVSPQMDGPQVRGGREHHAWCEGERCPDQARPTTGRRADAQKHQSRRQAPAFWELVGLTLDGRRAHLSHTW